MTLHRDLDSIEPTSGDAVGAAVQQRLQVLQMRDRRGAQKPEGSTAPGPDWRRELADAMAAERQSEAAAQQEDHGGSAFAPGGMFAEDIDEGGWLPK
jgi:hypothetical protein